MAQEAEEAPGRAEMILSEFESVKSIIKSYARTRGGKEVIARLSPKSSPSFEDLKNLIYIIEELEINIELWDIEDIEKILQSVRAGTLLEPAQLYRIVELIDLSFRVYEKIIDTPLQDRIPDPQIIAYLKREITSKIDRNGEVKDTASETLKRLREQRRKARKELIELYEKLLDKYDRKGYLRERNVVLKGGRMVLPVYSHVQMEGIIHGYSKTTETIFVEPMEVVPLQNRYVKLEDEEREEVRRILSELVERLSRSADYLMEIYRGISYLDSLLARYRFMKDYRGTIPSFNDEERIEIEDARHPLLIQVKGLDNVVPLSLSMKDKKGLLISGPNAGGKTVALKTIALIFLMAKSEIPVIATKVNIFLPDRLFEAGFEDEQDVLEGMSSFTSYLKRIKEVLEEGKRDDIVFFDELLSSTDPYEASALAFAIIETLVERGLYVFANTHLSPLKMLCERYGKIEVGSMEFDINSATPTYRLVIGKSGESFALLTARRVGIPEYIIEKARKYLGDIEGEIRTLKERLRMELALLERERKELERRERELERKEQKIIDHATLRAQRIIEQAQKEVDRLYKEIRKAQPGEKLKVVQQAKKALKRTTPQLEEVEEVIPGEKYYMLPFGVQVEVKEVRGKKAIVLLHGKEIETPIKNLRKKV